MGVHEVFVDRHGLVGCGGDDGQLDVGGTRVRRSTGDARISFSIVFNITNSWLIGREGRTVGCWSRSAIDDFGSVTIDLVGWSIESIEKVIGLARLGAIQDWSFEARWEMEKASVLVEVGEEVVPHGRDFTHVEYSS